MEQRSEERADGNSGTDGYRMGRFSWEVDSGRLTWTPEVFAIHGFAPGEVLPTQELVESHIHPEDLPDVTALVRRGLEARTPFGSLYRLVDARRRVRTVLAIGHVVPGQDGDGPVVEGHLVDLSWIEEAATQRGVTDAVQEFKETRAVIEQAKGVLVQLYAIDAEEAFGLMARFSQEANLRVRALAARLVEAAQEDRTPGKHNARDPFALLAEVAGPAED
jgi:hypothetical protein